MDLLRFSRRTAIAGLALFAVLSPHIAAADCPTGSGITFPFLTDAQLACQRVTFNATVDYFYSFISARQDCFTKEIVGIYAPNVLDCLAPITDEGPTTTGDEDTDRRLRVAEAQFTSAILTACTNVDLSKLGYPGFCDDPTTNTPYDAFDHNQCLLTRTQRLGSFIIDSEHPQPFPDDLEFNEGVCQDQLARLSSRLTSTEFERRGRCLLRQMQRVFDLPPEIDCRREVDLQAPDTGRSNLDDEIVDSHNHILRSLPSACPAINVENLGFPWRCEFPDNDSVFPLPALTECMFDFHHQEVFRFLDVIFPCSTKCGNGILNVEEQCDDGDNFWMRGDFCRRDCSRVKCGDTNDDNNRNIVDALYILQAAVGLQSCTLLVCDVTGDLRIRASDALRMLQFSVGLPIVLNCPDLSTTCGNGFLEEKETCDDGDSNYNSGEFCNSACLLVLCGDTDDSHTVSITDAQYILNASVNNVLCDKSVCDLTGNNIINSTDALRALMWSVGLPVDFNCPAPPPTPPAPPIE
jgi:cysteine-rich repeat protein